MGVLAAFTFIAAFFGEKTVNLGSGVRRGSYWLHVATKTATRGTEGPESLIYYFSFKFKN